VHHTVVLTSGISFGIRGVRRRNWVDLGDLPWWERGSGRKGEEEGGCARARVCDEAGVEMRRRLVKYGIIG